MRPGFLYPFSFQLFFLHVLCEWIVQGALISASISWFGYCVHWIRPNPAEWEDCASDNGAEIVELVPVISFLVNCFSCDKRVCCILFTCYIGYEFQLVWCVTSLLRLFTCYYKDLCSISRLCLKRSFNWCWFSTSTMQEIFWFTIIQHYFYFKILFGFAELQVMEYYMVCSNKNSRNRFQDILM